MRYIFHAENGRGSSFNSSSRSKMFQNLLAESYVFSGLAAAGQRCFIALILPDTPSQSLMRCLTCAEMLKLKWQWWIIFMHPELRLFTDTFTIQLLNLIFSRFLAGCSRSRQCQATLINTESGLRCFAKPCESTVLWFSAWKEKKEPSQVIGCCMSAFKRQMHELTLLQQCYKSWKLFERPYLWHSEIY